MDINVPVLQAVIKKLGGPSVLGSEVTSQADLANAVRRRLPLEALRALTASGMSDLEIYHFVIPQRTKSHRQKRHEPLTVEESDKTVRFLRIQTMAEQVFGSTEKANRWLRKSLSALKGETPLEMAQTETSSRVVETILGKIAWGAAA